MSNPTSNPTSTNPPKPCGPAFYEGPWFVAAMMLLALLLISVLSRIASGVRNPVAKETLQQTETLLKAANKWAMMAEQDSNLIMALMHINYANAYVLALRRILSDDQIQRAHQGVDMVDLESKMERIQHKILTKISEEAPDLMPDGEFAVRTGWLG